MHLKLSSAKMAAILSRGGDELTGLWRHMASYILVNIGLSVILFRHHSVKHMMTSSNGNIFRVTGHLCGEFTGPRRIPRTKASDAELWNICAFNKRLSKQSWGWWFETPSRPLWRHCNEAPADKWRTTLESNRLDWQTVLSNFTCQLHTHLLTPMFMIVLHASAKTEIEQQKNPY